MIGTTGYKIKQKHRILTDKYGREMRKLRVSLTDHCNYRCLYCMPEGQKFQRKLDMLKVDEYQSIISSLLELGLEEVRITGGEPTLHPEFREIIQGIAKTNPKKLGLTSNGQLLEKHLVFLKMHKVNHLNISLDSLDPGKFHEITQGGDFDQVLHTIMTAKTLGFNIKINVVVMKGINSDEIMDFVRWSEKTSIEVRFLEYMKIGSAIEKLTPHMITADEMITEIKKHKELRSLFVPKDSTSFNFVTERGGKIGFIASESKAFCSKCSRLRLTSTGLLHGCLFKENGLSVKNLDKKELVKTLRKVIADKPTDRIPVSVNNMNFMGG